MAELKGTFYGVSVGPGDPELMTLPVEDYTAPGAGCAAD